MASTSAVTLDGGNDAVQLSADTSANTKINGQKVSVELDSIEEALKAIAAGEIVVVVDDMDRENEGDLIMAASQCTTEKMAWIVRWSRWVDQAGLLSGAARGASRSGTQRPSYATADFSSV
jgi:hypothetical protein